MRRNLLVFGFLLTLGLAHQAIGQNLGGRVTHICVRGDHDASYYGFILVRAPWGLYSVVLMNRQNELYDSRIVIPAISEGQANRFFTIASYAISQRVNRREEIDGMIFVGNIAFTRVTYRSGSRVAFYHATPETDIRTW